MTEDEKKIEELVKKALSIAVLGITHAEIQYQIAYNAVKTALESVNEQMIKSPKEEIEYWEHQEQLAELEGDREDAYFCREKVKNLRRQIRRVQ